MTDEQVLVDKTHNKYVSYIERTRAFYLAEGFGNPYEWATNDETPFAPLTKPLAECRVALITTAAPYQPDKGDQGPTAPYNNDAKFKDVYTLPTDSTPDLRISHIGYDRVNTVPEDMAAFFPLDRAKEAVASGRIGSLAPRFYAVPTLRSQRATTERDVPAIIEMCREDAVDIAIICAV